METKVRVRKRDKAACIICNVITALAAFGLPYAIIYARVVTG